MSGGKRRREEGKRKQQEAERRQAEGEREREAYEREQQWTVLYREALKAIREETEQAVKVAVRSETPTAADWEGIVRRVVREEMAEVEHAPSEGPGPVHGREPSSKPWRMWVVAVGAGVVATAVLLGAGWWAGRQWGPPTAEATDPAGVPGVATDTIAPLADTMLDAVADTSAVGADTLSATDADTLATDTLSTGTSAPGASTTEMDTSTVRMDTSLDIGTDKTDQTSIFLQALSPDTVLDIAMDKLGLEISLEDVP